MHIMLYITFLALPLLGIALMLTVENRGVSLVSMCLPLLPQQRN